MMSHAEANALFRATRPARELVGERAIILAQAVAYHESKYASGWRNCPGMLTSNNMGAIQGPGFVCSDTHADGSKYTAQYRVYPSLEAGAAGLWHELWRRPGVRRVLLDNALDVRGLARAMRKSGYFEATETSYVRALQNAVQKIRAGLVHRAELDLELEGDPTTRPELTSGDGVTRGLVAVGAMGLLAGGLVWGLATIQKRA